MHGIPHLVWWNREEERLVEYGSSFAALRASGLVQGLRDTVVNLNERHLLRSAETIFEALEGAGLTTAAINITTYRGRHRHLSPIPGFPPVHGPKRFFFYSLYESDRTGAPIAFLTARSARSTPTRPRSGAGSSRATASTCSSTTSPTTTTPRTPLGPDAAHEALAPADAAIAALFDAAGGPDEFLDRYAVVLCSDHGQTLVEQAARLEVHGGLVDRLEPCGDGLRRATRGALAEALDGEPSVDVALFLEDGEVVARRDGEEDLALLDEYPDGRERADAALRNPNAGEVLVSAAPGWEFADLGRPPPRRRRQPRRARRERLRGADADRRARRAAGVDHRRSRRSCSSTSGSPAVARR